MSEVIANENQFPFNPLPNGLRNQKKRAFFIFLQPSTIREVEDSRETIFFRLFM